MLAIPLLDMTKDSHSLSSIKAPENVVHEGARFK
jgi:hypothetical protein